MKAEENRILTENEQQQVTGGTDELGITRKATHYETIMGLIKAELEALAKKYYKGYKSYIKRAELLEIREAFYEKFGYPIDDCDM